ncbi:MAG: YwiC-like family protein [Propionibacteriaceae bacterium]|nr:YwiC-like family protein [Propionibacteriaceae bacterium]
MPERTRTAGWLPNQHGAWAMLVVPFAVGTILCWRAGGLQVYLLPMLATWILGYFAFHAASGLLKSPPSRRYRWLPALAVYGTASLAAGLATVWLAGPAVLWWPAVFALPLGVALWLASRRQERHLAGGMLTTLLASAMVLVARFPDPLAMPADPAFPAAGLLAAVTFGYFGGTVLHVKSMIRNRGQLAWRNASIGWYAAWTVGTAGLVIAGALGRAWPVFFLVATVRAWLLPVIASRRAVRPLAIGLVEIALSAALLALAAIS